MSGIEAGIPLWDGLGTHHSGDGRDYFGVMHYRDKPHTEDRREPTHRAYPVEYDAARDAVVEAAQAYLDADDFTEAWRILIAALDALAAAGSDS